LGDILKSEQPFTVEVLSSFFLNIPADKSIEIEIGCGNGHFITAYGERKTDTQLVGLDTKEKRCVKTLKKINHKGLQNITIIRGRGEECLELLPLQRIDAFHLYFPDPWPKKKHHRRRFFKQDHLEQMFRCLAPGGRIYFATDMYEYYLQAKMLMALYPELEIKPELPPQEMYNSVFCQRFTAVEDPIFTVIGEKIKEKRESLSSVKLPCSMVKN
jgi:tRNA (guanine-N7-)-methyltransferase